MDWTQTRRSMSKRTAAIAFFGSTVSAAALLACGGGDESSADRGLPQGGEKAKLDPADFTVNIDNPYLPMAPGDSWVYRETDTEGTNEKVVIVVTDKTKKLANGVTVRVVRDAVSEGGKPVEVEHDWFAQDKKGNVWYFGGDVRHYENGKFAGRDGSFEAGVKGADAGVLMPADPEPGLRYRQEYLKGQAEDNAEIVTIGKERVDVPAGFFDNIVLTRDLVPTEPKVQEMKFYARGVGPVLTLNTNDPGARVVLLKYTRRR
jgi:hypothetical protein